MGFMRRCFSARTAPVLLWLLGLAIFFRSVALSFLTRVIGDDGDGQLIVSLHEHWYRVLQGLEGWNETLFFYPFQHALGYSDTFLATGLAYSAFRHFGADPFLALQGVYIALATLGYVTMAVWLRRYRRFGRLPAAIGALLFVVASPVFIAARNSHLQLLSVWLLPLGLILMEQSIAAVQAKRAPWAYYLGFAFWFGLLAYSTFYIAFFFALLCLLGLVAAGLTQPRKTIEFFAFNVHEWRQLIPALMGAAFWISLFLTTYLPARKETGGRRFEELMARIPQIPDLFNHADSHFLWGALYRRFWPYADPHNTELMLGLTPLFAVLALLAALVILVRPFLRSQAALAIGALVLIGGYGLLLRHGDYMTWKFVYAMLPGAEAIRVPSRLSVLLVIPAILMLAWVLDVLLARPGWPRRLGAVLAVLLVAEQIQLVDPANLHRSEKLRLARRAHPPPEGADAFLAFSAPWRGWNRDVPQNTAIFLAERWSLPTVNGRSGFAPPGWGLFNMDRGAALHQLTPWARASGLKGRVALYDISTNEWFRCLDFGVSESDSLLDVDLLSLPPDRWEAIALQGWSGQEPWGIWSTSEAPTLALHPGQSQQAAAALSITARAYVHPQQPNQTLRLVINGTPVAEWFFTLEQPVIRERVSLPEALGPVRQIRFEVASPVSPSSLGAGDDERRLGIGLESLVLHRAPHEVASRPAGAP